MGFLNYAMGEKELLNLIAVLQEKGPAITVLMSGRGEGPGFKYATRFGATIAWMRRGPGGQEGPPQEANSRSTRSAPVPPGSHHQRGALQPGHRVWSSTNELITNELMDELKKDHDGFNPVYMMAHSGARGSRSQIRQLGGMRGSWPSRRATSSSSPSAPTSRKASRSSSSSSPPRRPQGLGRHGPQDGRRRLPHAPPRGHCQDVSSHLGGGLRDHQTHRAPCHQGREDIVEHLHDRISGRYSRRSEAPHHGGADVE